MKLSDLRIPEGANDPVEYDSAVDVIERCLLLTTVGWESAKAPSERVGEVGIIRSIGVGSVLAKPWNRGRLDRCRRQLAEGTKPPPIKVVGLRRRGHKTLYSVGDGMHRTTAAREAGKKTVRAEISGWHTCDPTRFVIWRGWLWRLETSGGYKSVTDDIDPDIVPSLIGLGVRIVLDDQPL